MPCKESEFVWGIKSKKTKNSTDQKKKKTFAGNRKIDDIPKHSLTFEGKHYEFPANGNYYFEQTGDLNLLESFGDQALIDKDAVRDKSVYCTSKCIFLTLDRITFNRALHHIE